MFPVSRRLLPDILFLENYYFFSIKKILLVALYRKWWVARGVVNPVLGTPFWPEQMFIRFFLNTFHKLELTYLSNLAFILAKLIIFQSWHLGSLSYPCLRFLPPFLDAVLYNCYGRMSVSSPKFIC